jgi:hypothetical protein
MHGVQAANSVKGLQEAQLTVGAAIPIVYVRPFFCN